MADHDANPERRRDLDMPSETGALILYQLSELKSVVREGFSKVEGRFDRVETRLTALERYRERAEARDSAEAAMSSNVNARWVPWSIASATLVLSVVLFVLGQH